MRVLMLMLFVCCGSVYGDEPKNEQVEWTKKEIEVKAKMESYEEQMDYKNALAKAEELLKLTTKRQNNSDCIEIALSKNYMGNQLYHLGKSKEALEQYDEAINMLERIDDGRVKPSLALVLSGKGDLLVNMGRYKLAKQNYHKALSIRKTLYKDKTEVISTLSDLGTVYEMDGKFSEALPYYLEGLAMANRLFKNKDDLIYAKILNNLGLLYVKLDQYEEAEKYLQRSLEMNKRLYNNNPHPSTATTLSNIGFIHYKMGNYKKAAEHLSDALDITEQIIGNHDHPILAPDKTNIGLVFSEMGRYEQALSYTTDALAMIERIKGDVDDPLVAVCLNNMGHLLRKMERYDKALPYYEQSLAMSTRLYSNSSHPEIASTLSNLASVHELMGNSDKALKYYLESISMMKQVYPGEINFRVAINYNNLGFLYLKLEQYQLARDSLLKSLSIIKQLYPGGHPGMATTLENIGSLSIRLDHPDTALENYLAALSVRKDFFRRELLQASLSESVEMINSTSDTRSLILAANRLTQQSSNDVYPSTWAMKSSILRALQARHRLIHLESNDSKEIKQLLIEIRVSRRQMTSLFQSPPSKQRDTKLTKLTKQSEQFERDLVKLIPEVAPSEPKVGELANTLPDQHLFVDFYRYYDFAADAKDKRQPRYTAFILDHTNKPNRVELGPAKPIEQAILAWRNAIITNDPAANEHAEQLRKLVWLPIENAFPNKPKGIYICTDEDLGRVPFAALPNGKGGVLLEDYALATVPSGPFLLEQLTRKDKTEAGAMLLAGGIDYGNGGVWPQLKGTNSELAQIRSLAGERELLQATDDKATTDWLMEALPKARFAHLATHGFFKADEFALEQKRLAESRAKQIAGLSPTMMIGGERSNAGVGVRNPLGYVGLVMAQANNPPKQSLDAGIASGVALMNLDLSKLDLAVLSACETGLGEFQSAAGVQNLQLAFHVASCRNVIASLWKVDDLATSALMARFYQALWVENQPPMEALRTAQLYVYHNPAVAMNWEQVANRGEIKKALKQPENYAKTLKTSALPTKTPVKYWAAFTLSGAGK